MNHPSLLGALLLAFLCTGGARAQETPRPDPKPAEWASMSDAASFLMLTIGPRLQQSIEHLLFARRDFGLLGHGALTYLFADPGSEVLVEARLEGDVGGMTNSWDMPTESYELSLLARGLFALSGEPPIVVGAYGRGSWSLQFREELDESHGYWLTAYELGPSVASGIPLGASVVALIRVSAPIVALVSRPEEHRLYNNDLPSAGELVSMLHRDLSVTTLDGYRGVDVEVDIPVLLDKDRLAQTFGYRFLYRTSTEPAPVSFLSHMLTLSLLVRL